VQKPLDVPAMNGSISVVAVMRQTAGTYVRQAARLLFASAGVVTVVELLGLSSKRGSSGLSVLSAIGMFAAIALFVAFVVSLAACAVRDGESTSVGELWRMARSSAANVGLVLFVAMIAFVVLASIASFVLLAVVVVTILNAHTLLPSGRIGAILTASTIGLVVGTLPTLLLITAWSVAVPVAVLERPGGLRSLGRSHQLVRGNRLSALMVIVLVAAVIWLVSFAGGVLAGIVGHSASTAGEVICGLLLAPVPVLAATSLYLQLLAARGSSAA
jgi:hypothetical protein